MSLEEEAIKEYFCSVCEIRDFSQEKEPCQNYGRECKYSMKYFIEETKKVYGGKK